jgi:uncharacterized protein YoaH (UPF0181 family)
MRPLVGPIHKHRAAGEWFTGDNTVSAGRVTELAKRLSPSEKKKRLREVQKLRDEGISLGSACQQVADRHGGRPSKGTLDRWVRAAEQEKATRPSTARRAGEKAGRDEQGNAGPTSGAEPLENAATSTPAQPGSVGPGSNGAVPGPNVTVADSGPELLQSGSPADATVNDEPSIAEVVHMPSDRAADLDPLEDNLRLRRALNEANREIRALRDLLVVYASR